MDHAPVLLVALSVAWLSSRYHRCLVPGWFGSFGAERAAAVCLRLEVPYDVPLPGLRSFVHAEVARHPLFDGRAWGMQVVGTTPAAAVVRVHATSASVRGARRLEGDLRASVQFFVAQDYPESRDQPIPADGTLAVPAVILDR